MKSITTLLFSFIIALLMVIVVGGAASGNKSEPGKPMVWSRIQERLSQRDAQLLQLKSQWREATTDTARWSLERQIQEAKKVSERDILIIQLEEARAINNSKVAEELEAALHRLDHPEQELEKIRAANPAPAQGGGK